MRIDDHTMHCCGIIEASEFWGMEFYSEEDLKKYFDYIENYQRAHRRNCVLVTLTHAHIRAIFERFGYKCIHEFPNMNSINTCYIYSKLLWPDREAYKKDIDDGKYKVPNKPMWAEEHGTEYVNAVTGRVHRMRLTSAEGVNNAV